MEECAGIPGKGAGEWMESEALEFGRMSEYGIWTGKEKRCEAGCIKEVLFPYFGIEKKTIGQQGIQAGGAYG